MPAREKGKRQADEIDAGLTVPTFPEVIRFQYACSLSRSCGIHAEDDKKQAVDHFMYLVHNGIFVRDSLFNLALTEYSLADYEKARNHCEDLYRQDPDNKQIKQLHAAIAYKHQRMLDMQKKDRDTTIGVTLGVGLTLAAVGVGFLLAGGKKKG